MPAISTTAAFMDRGSNCYDTLHPYATRTISIHAHRLARATVIPGMSAADYEQQLALDLWQRLPDYKPERAGLATFIDRTVRHRVCGFLTAAQAVACSSERWAMTLNPRESAHCRVAVDFPASPVDDAVISVYGSLDGTSWTATPFMVLVLDKDVDPNSIDFLVTGVYQFRIGVKRSGSTTTFTSADLAFRKDGVSV